MNKAIRNGLVLGVLVGFLVWVRNGINEGEPYATITGIVGLVIGFLIGYFITLNYEKSKRNG